MSCNCFLATRHTSRNNCLRHRYSTFSCQLISITKQDCLEAVFLSYCRRTHACTVHLTTPRALIRSSSFMNISKFYVVVFPRWRSLLLLRLTCALLVHVCVVVSCVEHSAKNLRKDFVVPVLFLCAIHCMPPARAFHLTFVLVTSSFL